MSQPGHTHTAGYSKAIDRLVIIRNLIKKLPGILPPSDQLVAG